MSRSGSSSKMPFGPAPQPRSSVSHILVLRCVRGALAAWACDEGEREQAEPRIEQPLRERGPPFGPALEVVALVVAVEERLREPPRGARPEPEPSATRMITPYHSLESSRSAPARSVAAPPTPRAKSTARTPTRQNETPSSQQVRPARAARSSRCRPAAAGSSPSRPWRFLAPPTG